MSLEKYSRVAFIGYTAFVILWEVCEMRTKVFYEKHEIIYNHMVRGEARYDT